MNIETKLKRVLLCIRFDGGSFCGWQVQINGRSVQETLQDAIEVVFGKRYALSGCGRTDSGVHANEYYCHTDIPENFQTERICAALNLFIDRKSVV